MPAKKPEMIEELNVQVVQMLLEEARENGDRLPSKYRPVIVAISTALKRLERLAGDKFLV